MRFISSHRTESFDAVCERNDVAGNFEGTLDVMLHLRSLCSTDSSVWDAVIHAFHFGMLNCQPEARKCKLHFYRTTCGAGSGPGCRPAEVRHVGPEAWL